MGVRLRLAGLAAGFRLRRASPGHPARPPPRAVPVVARQPRHAGMPRPGVRPGPGRLVPRRGVPSGGPIGARLLPVAMGPRNVHGRISAALDQLRYRSGAGASPGIRDESRQPGLYPRPARARTAGHCAARLGSLRTLYRIRCADRAGAARGRHPRRPPRAHCQPARSRPGHTARKLNAQPPRRRAGPRAMAVNCQIPFAYTICALMSVSDLRQDYARSVLLEEAAAPSPFEQFNLWFAEALDAKVPEPNAMTLATVDAAGQPSARIVLVKGYDERGFAFFTNYESRK